MPSSGIQAFSHVVAETEEETVRTLPSPMAITMTGWGVTITFGVQDPTPSWGKLISDGQRLIVTRPTLALAPGIAIVLTVLSLNVFGDGLRDALDPRAKVRVEH